MSGEPLRLPDAVDEALGRLSVAIKLMDEREDLAVKEPDRDPTHGYDLLVVDELLRGIRATLELAREHDKGAR